MGESLVAVQPWTVSNPERIEMGLLISRALVGTRSAPAIWLDREQTRCAVLVLSVGTRFVRTSEVEWYRPKGSPSPAEKPGLKFTIVLVN
jgi:hypothetical protein